MTVRMEAWASGKNLLLPGITTRYLESGYSVRGIIFLLRIILPSHNGNESAGADGVVVTRVSFASS